MSLKSMALTKAEQKESGPQAVSAAGERDRFPWGLSLSLDAVALKKLDRKGRDFESGEYVTLLCKARVESKTTRDEDGKEDVSVHLQIEAMDVVTGEDKAAKAYEKRFGNGQ